MISAGVLNSKDIIKAFENIDRSDFIKPEYISEAYEDYPLPIGQGQTISQPTTVAFMLELLQPKRGHKILDVGSGSGWTTALLAQIVGRKGKVIGTEIVSDLVKFGQQNLAKYDLPQAKIVKSNLVGYPEEAPYDRILVSASANKLPKELIEQLASDAIMVLPIESSIFKIKAKKGKIETEEFPGFSFVPLRNQRS